MSIHLFEIQMWYMCFVFDDDDVYVSYICCDRMYEMFMYVYFDVIYANLAPC